MVLLSVLFIEGLLEMCHRLFHSFGPPGDVKRFITKQPLFIDFVLQHYVTMGVQELAQEKLAPLLRLRLQLRGIW